MGTTPRLFSLREGEAPEFGGCSIFRGRSDECASSSGYFERNKQLISNFENSSISRFEKIVRSLFFFRQDFRLEAVLKPEVTISREGEMYNVVRECKEMSSAQFKWIIARRPLYMIRNWIIMTTKSKNSWKNCLHKLKVTLNIRENISLISFIIKIPQIRIHKISI